jgi:hypothetical protein
MRQTTSTTVAIATTRATMKITVGVISYEHLEDEGGSSER